MSLDTTEKNPALQKRLFDPSAKCFQVVRPREPDLSVDGLAHASMFERVLALLGRTKRDARRQA